MKIEIGEGTEIETSKQEDIDYVEENFREGERMEHEVFGSRRTLVSDLETCWTVRHKGDVIGYFGVAIPRESTPFHPARWLCYMSCANAEKYKFMYVKQSRTVMRKVIEGLPEYVTEFLSLPAEKYKYMYVKQSRLVMRKVVESIPEHVTEFLSLPAEKYGKSVRWHERVLRMRRLKTVELNGERFVVFGISRRIFRCPSFSRRR